MRESVVSIRPVAHAPAQALRCYASVAQMASELPAHAPAEPVVQVRVTVGARFYACVAALLVLQVLTLCVCVVS